MSEYLPFMPEEHEPSAVIKAGDEQYLATRRNTVINTYIGRQVFDNINIFDRVGEEWSITVFRESPNYPDMLKFFTEKEFPMALNQPEVPGEVVDLYVAQAAANEADEFPEEWGM